MQLYFCMGTTSTCKSFLKTFFGWWNMSHCSAQQIIIDVLQGAIASWEYQDVLVIIGHGRSSELGFEG